MAEELYEQTIIGWKDTRQDVPPISLFDKGLALVVYNAAALVSKAPELAVETAKKTVKSEVRKVKLSSLIDATDEPEVGSASPEHVTTWHANLRNIKHGDPLPDKGPTPDHIDVRNGAVRGLRSPDAFRVADGQGTAPPQLDIVGG